MVDLIEVVFSSIFTLLSPEKTVEKIKDINTSKSAKKRLIVLFTLIYGMALIGIFWSIFLVSDVVYKVFAVLLTIFLLYCLIVFYYRIHKYR